MFTECQWERRPLEALEEAAKKHTTAVKENKQKTSSTGRRKRRLEKENSLLPTRKALLRQRNTENIFSAYFALHDRNAGLRSGRL